MHLFFPFFYDNTFFPIHILECLFELISCKCEIYSCTADMLRNYDNFVYEQQEGITLLASTQILIKGVIRIWTLRMQQLKQCLA
jgi:hypothetical protein